MPIHATTPAELARAKAEHDAAQGKPHEGAALPHPTPQPVAPVPVAAPAEPVKPRTVADMRVTLPGYLGPILLQH